MSTDDQSSLGRLKKGLYSRTRGAIKKRKRRRLEPKEYKAKSEWEHDTDVQELFARASGKRFKKPSFTVIFLIGSFIFFILAALIALLFFISGGNILSPGNIDIGIAGPVTIDAGEELELFITITNHNASPLEATDLLVEFSDGTRDADDLAKELVRFRESMGTIASNQSVQKIVRSVPFGEEGSTHETCVTFEYRLQGSNAIFFKEKCYKFTVSASPVRLSIESVKEINSGQEAVFVLDIFSNSPTVIENVLLTAEYPFGFTFKEAIPEPSSGKAIWSLGDLESGSKRTITLRGVIEGQNEEDRIFRFNVGIQDSRNDKRISTQFLSQLQNIRIKRPFLGVELALGGVVAPEYATPPGDIIRVDITWTNNLSTRIVDGEIEAKISGIPLDKTSVTVSNGFYRSIDNVVFWTKQTDEQLLSLEPGGEGRVSFSFNSFPSDSAVLSALRDPEMSIDVSVKGRRVSEEGVPEVIISTASSKIKVMSDLVLTSQLLYFSGPFINSGPVPPAAERETTYTAVWSITNTTNEVEGVKVVAALPPYVRWMGVTSPSGEDISFNPVGGSVVWNVGDTPAGTGIASSPRSVSFQVALLPSVSQIGLAPTVVQAASASGVDIFAREPLNYTARELSTVLGTDPQYRPGQDRVVE